MIQKNRAEWAQREMRLSHIPNHTTISRILKYLASFTDIPQHQCAIFKKIRSEFAPQLEATLYQWVCKKTSSEKQINGPLIVKFSEELQTEVKKHLPAEKQLKLQLARIWLEKFRKNNSLVFRRVHGEELSEDK